MKPYRAFPLSLLVLLGLCWTAQAQVPRQHLVLPTRTGSISIETFASGNRPAVIILSGAKGFDAPAYDEMAETLDAAGLDVFLVHFLSPGDIEAISSAKSARARIRYYGEHLSQWSEAILAAISYLDARPRAAGRIGVVGISLGAQVAAATLADSDQVAGLVLVDGGFPNDYSRPIRSMPPLLLIWGGADQTFPLSIGQDLERMAHSLGGSVRLDVYEGAAHDFFVHAGTTQGKAAHRDMADFLATQLLP